MFTETAKAPQPSISCGGGHNNSSKYLLGKPLETVGRKARGWGAKKIICKMLFFCMTLVRLHLGEPSETAGSNARGCGAFRPMLVRLPDTFASD